MHRFFFAILSLALVSACDSELSAQSTALAWARMDPVPESATAVSIEILGNPFTREFVLVFVAPRDAIVDWLEQSEGISDATSEESGGVVTYGIKPGEGAAFAEVRIDWKSNRVQIHTYWS